MHHRGNVRLLGQVDRLLFLDVHRLWDACFASPVASSIVARASLWSEKGRVARGGVSASCPSVAGVFPVSLFQAEKKELGRVDFGRKVKTGKYSLLLDEV